MRNACTIFDGFNIGSFTAGWMDGYGYVLGRKEERGRDSVYHIVHTL
jgi:hypothetical protein